MKRIRTHLAEAAVLAIAAILLAGIGACVYITADNIEKVYAAQEEPEIIPVAVLNLPDQAAEPEPTQTPTPQPEPEPEEPEPVSLGTYRVTAYCSCEKCCNKWAKNRPTDETGMPIIYTADGSIAQQGVTVAADTDVLPFGTKLTIDGHTYTVQDRGGSIKGHRIDVYFESHQEALEWGVRYLEVFAE